LAHHGANKKRIAESGPNETHAVIQQKKARPSMSQSIVPFGEKARASRGRLRLSSMEGSAAVLGKGTRQREFSDE
jgi:hypothetical protein